MRLTKNKKNKLVKKKNSVKNKRKINNKNKLNNFYSYGGGIFRNSVEQYRESKRFLSNFNQ